MNIVIHYSPKFAHEYKRLPITVKKLAEQKENIFRSNPHDTKLKTHKLHGRLSEFWSFSVDKKYRIIFEFGENNIVYFYSVGDHHIYD